MKNLKNVFKNLLGNVVFYVRIIVNIIWYELLVQILAPVVFGIIWVLLLPVKIVVLIIKSDKLTKSIDEYEELLDSCRSNCILHYSILYILIKTKYDIACKIGFAL